MKIQNVKVQGHPRKQTVLLVKKSVNWSMSAKLAFINRRMSLPDCVLIVFAKKLTSTPLKGETLNYKIAQNVCYG